MHIACQSSGDFCGNAILCRNWAEIVRFFI